MSTYTTMHQAEVEEVASDLRLLLMNNNMDSLHQALKVAEEALQRKAINVDPDMGEVVLQLAKIRGLLGKLDRRVASVLKQTMEFDAHMNSTNTIQETPADSGQETKL